jgi:hypothetical protein
MSLKSILLELGVAHPHRFSSIVTNWYRQLQVIQAKGFEVRVFRIGAKRVTLALQHRRNQTNYAIWLIALLCIVAASAGPIFMSRHHVSPKSKPVKESCSRLVSGFSILKFSDWHFSIELVHSLGNVSQYQTVATCRENKWSGLMLLSESEGDKIIKKLTPTK